MCVSVVNRPTMVLPYVSQCFVSVVFVWSLCFFFPCIGGTGIHQGQVASLMVPLVWIFVSVSNLVMRSINITIHKQLADVEAGGWK